MFGRVGIDHPTIEVRFENLNIDAEAYVGNRGIPTFTNYFSNKIMVCAFSVGPALDASWNGLKVQYICMLSGFSYAASDSSLGYSGFFECPAHCFKREEAHLYHP